MGEVEHEQVDNLTPFEKRYLPYINQINEPNQRKEISNKLAGIIPQVPEEKRTLNEQMTPHQGFVDAYNEMAIKEHRAELRKKSQHLFNEDGKRYGKNWYYEGYRNMHDPLRIFEKKGNYEDLAWKVFNEVDDSNIYLKALYYPRLTSEDLQTLLDKFEEQYKTYANKKKLSVFLSFGSAFGTWALAYRYRWKFSSFLLSTTLAFFGTYWGLSFLIRSNMKRNINKSANKISNKYPEIKFSRIEYVNTSETSSPKLL